MFQFLDTSTASVIGKICAAQYSEQVAFKVPIVEAVLVELDLQRLARDGAAGEVGKLSPKK